MRWVCPKGFVYEPVDVKVRCFFRLLSFLSAKAVEALLRGLAATRDLVYRAI